MARFIGSGLTPQMGQQEDSAARTSLAPLRTPALVMAAPWRHEQGFQCRILNSSNSIQQEYSRLVACSRRVAVGRAALAVRCGLICVSSGQIFSAVACGIVRLPCSSNQSYKFLSSNMIGVQ